MSLVSSLAMGETAQALTVTEPPDHSNTIPGTAHVLEVGTNTISGRLQTPGDGQDNFRVTVPAGHLLNAVTLSLNTGGGFSGFVTWNTSETRMSSGSFSTGLPAGAGTYQLQAVANFSVGNNWSLTFTVVKLCSDPTECADGIECTLDVCSGGVCSNPPRSVGAGCGSSANTECSARDTCDGAGSCLPNHAAAGAACGDQGLACTVDDACDGAGSCVDNGFDASGTPCGDPTDDACTDPDTCDGSGTCLANHAAAGAVCEAGTFCTSGDGCMEGACIEGSAMTCAADEKCDEEGDLCFSACGDGVVDDGEACDEGGANSDTEADACRSDCTLPICGDGVTDDGEACDDGGPTDDCTADCELPMDDDAGVPEADAGSPAEDAAVPADGGTEPDDGGTEPDDGGTEPADSDGGCSCRVAGAQRTSSRAPWALGGLALAAFVRRRRR